RRPADRPSFTSPVIDYEPAPVPGPTPMCPTPMCPTPRSAALHRHTPRALRSTPRAVETPAPTAAAVFAEAVLRRVLEVIDRRRPLAQLQPLIDPALYDSVAALTRSRHAASATLRRVRLRSAAPDAAGTKAAEVFATYSRGVRLRAIAGRVEQVAGSERWRLVALQVG
ncbi:Rv3235 family protein, partial [Micromonospora sp. WMMD736]|uniref:Rv3235 family protein n=1 Tax=Micromonospora sp. WMMD736 TaxID=3404112 RepID=UPI003B95AEDB